MYWLLGLFALWMLVSGIWYLVGVRALSTDPAAFEASSNIAAIVEVCLMLLVSFLIGFMIAYKLRDLYVRSVWVSFQQLLSLLDQKGQELHEVQLQISLLERDRAVMQEKFQAMETYSTREMGWLQQQLDQARGKEKELSREIAALTARGEQLEGQISHLQLKLIDTEKELQHKPAKFIKPDDLTKIKGIGPFIERRLNKMGIYTYQQIGEMDEESIQKVGETIKFFPDRILRDDWIGQARRLS